MRPEIYQSSPQDYVAAYNIFCRALPNPTGSAPFGSTHCRIPPRGFTAPHAHKAFEVFVIQQGEGVAVVGGRVLHVRPGDRLTIPAGEQHILFNTSGSDPLIFLSIDWQEAEPCSGSDFTSVMISAPPTPNGQLHLGHVSGPYLAADVAHRYVNAHAGSVMSLSGLDAHQSYILTAAAQNESGAAMVVESHGEKILMDFANAEILHDTWLRPHDDALYHRQVQEKFLELVKLGLLKRKTLRIAWCDTCEIDLYGGLLSGCCPHCAVTTFGSLCEACGLPNDPSNLPEACCVLCGNPPTIKEATRYALAREVIEGCLGHLQSSWRETLREAVGKLPGWLAVSHRRPWGIPIPGCLNEDPVEVIDEWVEMALAYATVAPTNGQAVWHQFFGVDNLFYYGALHPCLLRALGTEAAVEFDVNHFLTLEGEKFSTSRGHAIWLDDALKKWGAAAVRFYLALVRPEEHETDFDPLQIECSFREQIQDPVERLLRRIEVSPSDVNSPFPMLSPVHQRILGHAAVLQELYEATPLRLQPIARALQRLLHDTELAEQFADLRRGIEVFAVLAAPLLPSFAHEIAIRLGIPSLEFRSLGEITTKGLVFHA